jgi:putative ABC transport system ATP-binding protein
MNIDTNLPIVAGYHISKQVQSGTETLEILRDVNITVARGETCAIMGVSGVGKSTLLALLAGLDTPTRGEIILLHQSIHDLNEDERARIRAKHVGFVFQNFYLLPNLSALENVMLPLELTRHPDAKGKAISYLERVGLHARLHHKPVELSGGEQQRVALARAFANGPDILFADEPTGNLDLHTGAQIIELLFHLNEEQNTTLIISTHDEQIAKRVKQCFVLEKE